MATITIEQYFKQSASYINWVFNHDSENRGGHHDYVTEQTIINLPTALINMTEDEIDWADFEAFQRLYKLDDEPNIFNINSADYDEEIGATVIVTLLDQELEFIVQLTGGEYSSQMGCQISHNDDSNYYVDSDKEIIAIFFDQIITAAENSYEEHVVKLKGGGNWEYIEDGEYIVVSATSGYCMIIEQKKDFDNKVDDYEYRVILEISGFTQPNDYSTLPDFTVDYFDSLESAQEWLNTDINNQTY